MHLLVDWGLRLQGERWDGRNEENYGTSIWIIGGKVFTIRNVSE
jgi:hypothetical protein